MGDYAKSEELRALVLDCRAKGKLTNAFALKAGEVFDGYLVRVLPKDEEARDEIKSRCFVRLVGNWENIDPDGNIFSWLSGIANYARLDHLRHEGRLGAKLITENRLEIAAGDSEALDLYDAASRERVELHGSEIESNPDIRAVYPAGRRDALFLYRGQHVALDDRTGQMLKPYQNPDGETCLRGYGSLHALHLEAFGEELDKLPPELWTSQYGEPVADVEAPGKLDLRRVNVAGVVVEVCREYPGRAWAVLPGRKHQEELTTSPRPGGGLLVHVGGFKVSYDALWTMTAV